MRNEVKSVKFKVKDEWLKEWGTLNVELVKVEG